jgi:hypothetical protein
LFDCNTRSARSDLARLLAKQHWGQLQLSKSSVSSLQQSAPHLLVTAAMAAAYLPSAVREQVHLEQLALFLVGVHGDDGKVLIAGS